MKNILTSTRHTLDFNLLPYDKFEELCYWLVEDSGEYEKVEYYGGTGDKNRDVVGYSDGELDYFQCKRYENPNYSILKEELDNISEHIRAKEIEKPRRIYFVLSSAVSSSAKDKLKEYAKNHELPLPTFWEQVVLDKKLKRNTQALENFFGIFSKKEDEFLPQIDTFGYINYGTHETRFTIVNNGNAPAIDCSWSLIGFAWPGYKGTPDVFNLKPEEEKELIIAMPGNFMGKKLIKELRLHFRFRDIKNNLFYSERYLLPEIVSSGEFYRINAVAGKYVPTQALLQDFFINSVDPINMVGVSQARLIYYTINSTLKSLKISISPTLSAIWQFDQNEMEGAYKELGERKIIRMIKTGKYEDTFHINSYLKKTQNNGFESYYELRESI